MLFVYDLLLSGLLLFPLLLGGFWLNQPGLKLEVVELGIPVLILAFLTWFVARAARAPLAESRVARAATRLWTRWQGALEDRPRRTIWLATTVIGCLWTLASVRRHQALGSGAADLGIFTGTFWNLTHGLGYHSPMKDWKNLFFDHQSPINYLIAPVFSLFPRAETLLAVQAFGLATGGAAVFRLCKKVVRISWYAAASPILYWAFLPTRNAYFFDFHPETLMLPLFLWALVAFYLRAWGRAGILLLLGLMGKESGGVVLAGIGLALVLGGGYPDASSLTATPARRRALGFGLLAFGVLLFVAQIKLVPRIFFGADYVYDAAYASYGGGLLSILASPIMQPGVFWPHLFGRTRLKFLLWTLGALGFLPLLNWRTAIAALPCFLMVFLTDGDHRVNLFYYYAIEASIGLFWALPGGLARAEAWLAKRCPAGARPRVELWLLFWSLALFDRSEVYRIRRFEPTAHAKWLQSELLPCLETPEIAAPQALVPHLAGRPWARELPELRVPAVQPDGSISMSDQVSCVITDPRVDAWPITAEAAAQLLRQLPGRDFRSIFSCQGTEVWAQRASPVVPRPWLVSELRDQSAEDRNRARCMRCIPPCPPPD